MLMDLFTKAGMVAWPLGLFSVLSVAIILERIITLNRLRVLEERAFMLLQMGLERGDTSVVADRMIAAAPVTRVLDSLSSMRGAGLESLEGAAEIGLSLQRIRLRRYLGTLATIGSTSPFIGLFGTVIGVMRAFEAMSRSSLSGEAMAAGISEALGATALGLLVAIPAVIAYNTFTGQVQALLLLAHGHVARLLPQFHAGLECPVTAEA